MANVTVKLVETPEERQAAFELRIRVFVHEQGVPAEDELDEDDATATHAIAVSGDSVVGTGRLICGESGEARIGRMAVEVSWRRRGVGGLILEALEEEARKQGMSAVLLHAQSYVSGFYASHGYVPSGEPFLEVGIEHFPMVKTL